MLGSFYLLNKRAAVLTRILKITDRIRREIARKEFVTQEMAMLIGMAPLRSHSKALDTANVMLRTLQMENTAPIPTLTPNTDHKPHAR